MIYFNSSFWLLYFSELLPIFCMSLFFWTYHDVPHNADVKVSDFVTRMQIVIVVWFVLFCYFIFFLVGFSFVFQKTRTVTMFPYFNVLWYITKNIQIISRLWTSLFSRSLHFLSIFTRIVQFELSFIA